MQDSRAHPRFTESGSTLCQDLQVTVCALETETPWSAISHLASQDWAYWSHKIAEKIGILNTISSNLYLILQFPYGLFAKCFCRLHIDNANVREYTVSQGSSRWRSVFNRKVFRVIEGQRCWQHTVRVQILAPLFNSNESKGAEHSTKIKGNNNITLIICWLWVLNELKCL